MSHIYKIGKSIFEFLDTTGKINQPKLANYRLLPYSKEHDVKIEHSLFQSQTNSIPPTEKPLNHEKNFEIPKKPLAVRTKIMYCSLPWSPPPSPSLKVPPTSRRGEGKPRRFSCLLHIDHFIVKSPTMPPLLSLTSPPSPPVLMINLVPPPSLTSAFTHYVPRVDSAKDQPF